MPGKSISSADSGSRPPAPVRPAFDSRAGKVTAALGLVYVVWGSTYLAIRIAIESIPPLLMAGARFLLAGVLMVAYARWVQRAPWPTARQWRDAAVVGACLLLVGNGGVTLGERFIPSGLTAMLVATVPMFMGLFGWWSGQSPRPSVVYFLALLVGFAGVCLLVRPAAPAASTPPAFTPAALYTGSGLVLLAAAVWAAGSLYARRADRPGSAVLNIGAQMLCGGTLLALAAAFRGEPASFHLVAVTAHSAWAYLYLVFVGALVGFSAYVWVLGVASPTLVGTYAFVNPGVAVFLGWAFAGETITTSTLLGMATILASVALIVLVPARPLPAAAAPTLPRGSLSSHN